MNRIMKGAVVLFASAGFLLAESWSGTLIDANCKPDPSAAGNAKGDLPNSCAATATTKVFAVQTPDGKTYRLDSAGNAKAAATMKSNDNKTSVTISGSMDGQMVKVESIDVNK
jgi:hypothetical protein